MAQFKFTVLLMPSGTLKITGAPFDPQLYSSEHGVTDPELKVGLLTLFYLLAYLNYFLKIL